MIARRWAWVVWAVTLLLTAVAIGLENARERPDVGEEVFGAAAIVSFATVGALITSRRSGNRVGLLFAWVGGVASVGWTSGEYAALALDRSLPFLEATAWLGRIAFPAMLGPLGFLFLVYPTGEPPSHRWRWLLRLMLAAYAVNLAGFALTPGRFEDVGFLDQLNGAVRNPVGLPESWRGAVDVVTGSAGLAILAGAFLSIVSLVQRFRRSDGVERQQIRWLLFLGAFLGVLFLTTMALLLSGVIPEDEDNLLGNLMFFAFIIGVFLGIPATSAVAILRYRLYDLDVVVKKTVLYGVLVVLILAVAGLGALLLGGMVIQPDDPSPSALILVGGLGGLLVWPLRRIAAKIADRLVYGGRASPYEALATFSHRVGDTYASEDVLPRMATILQETTRAETATVWLRVGTTYRPVATSGVAPPPVPATGDEVPELPGDHVEAVRHQGDLLGALGVEMPANDPIDRTRERLIEDLASQAGAVLRNVRLIEELRASRQRLVAAQDKERRKLERNLHDGAQQQLVALSVRARLAQAFVVKDPEKATAELTEIQAGLTDAIEELRDLARGIYPPLLADQGLAAALEAQVRRSAVPITVEQSGIGRYPREAEAAVYFCCLEALQNVAKYAAAQAATVRLAPANGYLTFEVRDDGVGFDAQLASAGTGLQGMADRLAAIGGTFEVRSAPGAGTTVAGRVPTGEASA